MSRREPADPRHGLIAEREENAMRTLRVLGIAEGGSHLVCADAHAADGESEKYALPLDDQVRAAMRGDLSRIGQLGIDVGPHLRPREIQSRIRAGATVDEVAAAAGCDPDRIERYAYPVLMERATIAERARRVRPLQGAALGSAGAASAGRSLEEIVIATLADRGQRPELAWDAFRDERGWNLTVTWHAGRSENRAAWAYRAGPDGGSLTALGEQAAELIEPGPRPLRTIEAAAPRGGERLGGTGGERGARVGDDPRREDGPRYRGDVEPGSDEELVESTVTDDRSGARAPGEAVAGPPRRVQKRGHRPPMPSWEDVLLGIRASGR